jgi:hypothetical protein
VLPRGKYGTTAVRREMHVWQRGTYRSNILYETLRINKEGKKERKGKETELKKKT